MKVGVIHSDIEAAGGAEYVCLNIVRALHDTGYKVGLCTTGNPSYQDLEKRMNIDIEDAVDYSLNLGYEQFPYFEIYQRVAIGYHAIIRLWKKFKPDLFVVTLYPAAMIPAELAKKTVTYVHSPIDFESVQYSGRDLLRQIYWIPIKFVRQTLDDFRDTELITNSKFSLALIKRLWNRDARIIYPPCPLNLDLPFDEKRNWVCTLGRFSPEKRYEEALEVAERLPNVEFHLIGNIIPCKQSYFNDIQKRASALKNVRIHANASFEEKKEVIRRSKVLLHTMYGEHFGIGLIEAMSSGTIPVPHNSGGAKEDGFIPPEFRWETIEDAVKIIQNFMDNWNSDLAGKLRESSKDFSQGKFQKTIIDHIRNLDV